MAETFLGRDFGLCFRGVRVFSWMLLFVASFSFTVSVYGEQSSLLNPHFGTGIVMLEGSRVVLSPEGSFAAGRRRVDENHWAVLLWDLRDAQFIHPMTQLEPEYSVSLEDRSPFGLITNFLVTFSPDEQYLAVRKDYDLTILSVPNFQVEKSQDVNVNAAVLPDELSWSSDSRLVATRGSGDIVVWDVTTNEAFRHPLDNTYGSIFAVEDGWLVTNYSYGGDERDTNAFSICTRLVESCTAYRFENLSLVTNWDYQPVVASPDGQRVLTRKQNDPSNESMWMWTYQQDGNYELEDEPLDNAGEDLLYPKLFSYDGKYLATEDWELVVWDMNTLMKTNTIPCGFCTAAFFPDTNYFVVLDSRQNFQLFQVGQSSPIDSLDISDWNRPPTDGFSDFQVAVSGNWALIDFKNHAWLIPIVHSD